MIKVLLVDDHPMVRQGLQIRLELEPDLEIVGQAESLSAALALVQSLDPDVLVMDADMTGTDCFALTRQLHILAPRTAVILLAMHSHAAIRNHARQVGASAFLEKRGASDEWVTEIRRAALGSGAVQPLSQALPGQMEEAKTQPLADDTKG